MHVSQTSTLISSCSTLQENQSCTSHLKTFCSPSTTTTAACLHRRGGSSHDMGAELPLAAARRPAGGPRSRAIHPKPIALKVYSGKCLIMTSL